MPMPALCTRVHNFKAFSTHLFVVFAKAWFFTRSHTFTGFSLFDFGYYFAITLDSYTAIVCVSLITSIPLLVTELVHDIDSFVTPCNKPLCGVIMHQHQHPSHSVATGSAAQERLFPKQKV